MKRLALLALMATVVVAPTASAVSAVSAITLKEWCTGVEFNGTENDRITFGHRMACMSYLQAVADTIDVYQQEPPLSVRVCVPHGSEGSLEMLEGPEMRDAFLKYLVNHPADEHLTAASVAYRAFQDAYPCSK
jgi:Rap1a immunity proteins